MQKRLVSPSLSRIMDIKSLRERSLVGAGVIAISIGAYLPWLKTNPSLPPDAQVPQILFLGMNAGLEGLDFVLLGSVGLALVLHGISSRKQLQTVFTLLAGVGAIVLCALYLSGSSLAGFTAIFVPALGWYLTVLGGVLLIIAGGLQLPSIFQRSEKTAARMD